MSETEETIEVVEAPSDAYAGLTEATRRNLTSDPRRYELYHMGVKKQGPMPLVEAMAAGEKALREERPSATDMEWNPGRANAQHLSCRVDGVWTSGRYAVRPVLGCDSEDDRG